MLSWLLLNCNIHVKHINICLCVHVVYTLLRYVMTNIHQLKRNCRINGANFDVQNGFTTQLRVCDWFAFDGSWLMSKYNFVYVYITVCVHTIHFSATSIYWLTHLFNFDSLPFYFTLRLSPVSYRFRVFFVFICYYLLFSSIFHPQSRTFSMCGFWLPLRARPHSHSFSFNGTNKSKRALI